MEKENKDMQMENMVTQETVTQETAGETKKNGRKKAVVIAAAAVLVAAGSVGAFAYWKHQNRFELKQKRTVIELGCDINTEAGTYIDAEEKTLKETKLDFDEVDNMTAGTYTVKAECRDKKLSFKLEVQDTVDPKVSLVEGEFKTIAGKEYAASNLIAGIEDEAGIESIAFKEAQIEVPVAEGDTSAWSTLGLKYDAPGQMENTLIVTDKSGNKTEQKFTVKVIEDYEAHVGGFKDFTVERGKTADWLANITKDEKIASVTADESAVDLSKNGEYTLKYMITGDDNETTLEKTVKVTVVSPVVQTAKRNTSSGWSGGSSYSGGGSSGGGNAYSGGSSSSGGGNTYSGGGSSGGGSNSGGGSSSGGNDMNPGQSWDYTVTGGGFIGGGDESTGSSTWESFDW